MKHGFKVMTLPTVSCAASRDGSALRVKVPRAAVFFYGQIIAAVKLWLGQRPPHPRAAQSVVFPSREPAESGHLPVTTGSTFTVLRGS